MPIMAQKTIVQLIDDLDGKELKLGQGETVTFGIDGVDYELDVSNRNAKKLRDALAGYVSAARKVGGSRSRGARTSSGGGAGTAKRDPEQTRAIREWAQRSGHQVSDRGRIPASVVDAYEQAHSG
jgi:hypothetical protein